ncbi:MAG: cytochrome c [Verrucomicrobiaceae bacterium]|nr:MAG: cytochrome c [Verrucomicrobiaceae bacterium]
MSRWARAAYFCLLLSACTEEPLTSIPAPLTGRDIYLAKCAACHQPDGNGIPNICPPLSTSPRLDGTSDEIIRIILLGMKGSIVREGKTYSGIMPAWRFDLGDVQIAAVVNDVYSRWKPGSPEVTEEQVRRIRDETAKKKLFPTEAELR